MAAAIRERKAFRLASTERERIARAIVEARGLGIGVGSDLLGFFQGAALGAEGEASHRRAGDDLEIVTPPGRFIQIADRAGQHAVDHDFDRVLVEARDDLDPLRAVMDLMEPAPEERQLVA